MPTKKKSIDQITDQDELLSAVKALYSVSEEASSERFKEVARNWKFYMGFQYLNEDLSPDSQVPLWKRDLRVTRNICFQHIETIRPILQRGYPKLYIHADHPEALNPSSGLTDGDLASRMQEVFEAEHERRDEGIENAKLIADVLVQGVGYRKVIYNSAWNRIEKPILPFDSVLVDPNGTKSNFEDHKYVIHRTHMDVADIKRLYGANEEDYASKGGEGTFTDPHTDSKFGIMRKVQRVMASGQTETKFQRKMYEVVELYYNAETNASSMAFNEKRRGGRRPPTRMVVMINQRYIPPRFRNFDIPFEHKEFPIVSYHTYPLAQNFHSRSEIDQLVSIQVAVNVLYSQVLINALLSSNVQWLVEEGAIPHNWLTNQPGLIIRVKPNKWGRIQRLDPAAIPAQSFQLVQELERFAQTQTHASDAVQGLSPGSGTSGVQTNALQAAAMVPHTFKMQMLDSSYRRDAKLEVSMFQQYVDFDDSIFRELRDLGEWTLWDEDMRSLLFDVAVESRSEFPQNVLARIQWGQQMLEAGLFDLEEFTDFVGVEVREDLREKIRALSETFTPGIPHSQQVALQMQSGQLPTSPQGGQQTTGDASGLQGLGGGVNPAALPQV